VYILAVPFYLFFNVRVTGDTIPEMQTLAYTLTPEIADWFRRIDPFTNGMPSLHIGIPFAVWLCLTRFDDDRRWNRYRHTVFAYTALTAFTIIYLGIHWFMDIIGGMLVAGAAVSMADRTSNTWWKFFDERTMNVRIVTVLTRPKKAWTWVKSSSHRMYLQYRSPTSTETGRMALAILIVVAAVITWDLTNRSLPAGGVEAPEAAAAIDGWMVTLDNQTEGAALLLHNLSTSTTEPARFNVPGLTLNASYAVLNDRLVVSNPNIMHVFDMEQPTAPIASFSTGDVNDVALCGLPQSMVVVYSESGAIVMQSLDGQRLEGGHTEVSNVARLVCSGSEIAYVTETAPLQVNVLQIGVTGQVSYAINATAPVEEDEVLAAWGTPVDMENATIDTLAFDRSYLAVTVNVSATDRLVLVNRSSAEQWLASNPKYEVSDPSMGHGILAWSVRDHLNPSSPQSKYLDREIYFLDLVENTTHVLTSDTNDQWGPQVLENHLVYFQLEDELVTVEIHAWEPELRAYSSFVLQAGVLLAFVVVAWHMWQRQSERRQAN